MHNAYTPGGIVSQEPAPAMSDDAASVCRESYELRPIPGYEGIYGVTRDGRVWSYPKAPAHGRKHAGMWRAIHKHPHGDFVVLHKDGVKRNRSMTKLLREVWA